MKTSIKGVNLGYLRLDWEFLCFPHPERLVRPGQPTSEHIWVDCPAIAYIIDHPDGKILFETGISERCDGEWPDAWKFLLDIGQVTPEVCLEHRLKEYGLGPDDFRYLVMGHLHCDHAGGMRIFRDAGADILVHEEEWKHVKNLQEQNSLESFFYSPADIAVLDEKAPTLVSGDIDIADGVKLVELPGHTPGLMGLQVELEHTGTVLLTSDALYYHKSYGPPAVGSPVTWDTVRHRESSEKIRRIALENDAYLFPGHDETAIRQFSSHQEVKEIQFSPDYAYE